MVGFLIFRCSRVQGHRNLSNNVDIFNNNSKLLELELENIEIYAQAFLQDFFFYSWCERSTSILFISSLGPSIKKCQNLKEGGSKLS